MENLNGIKTKTLDVLTKRFKGLKLMSFLLHRARRKRNNNKYRKKIPSRPIKYLQIRIATDALCDESNVYQKYM